MSDSLFAPSMTIDPNKDYSAELVGEDKKFKSVADLARGKVEADLLIKQQQAEAAELRAELARRKTMEDAVAMLSKTNSQTNSDNGANALDSGSAQAEVALGEEKINSLIREQVETLIKSRTETETKQSNLNTVRQALEDAWGKDFGSRLVGVAEELGTTQEYLTSIAQTQPKAFLKLVGADQKPAQTPSLFSASGAGVSTAALAKTSSSNLPQEERYSYWQKVRKEDPAYYHSVKAANLRFEAIKKHGDAFLTT